MKKYNKLEVIQAVRDFAQAEKRWVTKSAISKGIGIPRTSILSMGIDTDEIFEEEGFPREWVNCKNPGSKERVVQPIIEFYKKLILQRNRPVYIYQLTSELGFTSIAEKSRFYRYGIDPVKVHLECGVEYHLNKKAPSKDTMENTLVDLIKTKNRYVTRDELADHLGISGSLLSFHGIKVDEVNLDHGFISSGRGFEFKVLDILKMIFINHTFELQKTFSDCRTSNDSRSCLRFDIYSPSLNLLVETDGPQHYDNTHPWYSDELVSRDIMKNKWAEQKDILLIRIKYDPNLTKEHVLSILSGTPLMQKMQG